MFGPALTFPFRRRMVAGSSHFAAAGIDTCFPPIAQTPVELIKGNEGWNQLATDFINGVTSGLSNELIEEIGNLIFGKGGDASKVATDLFNSQTPIVIFIAVGIAFSALTFIGAVVTLIWACTCRWNSKGIKSQCINITGIILAFISFGFVVSGITLYCLSVDSFVDGVLKAPEQLTTIGGNVNTFTTGAASQISCSVNNGFGQISTEVEKLPDEIVDLFNTAPGVIDVLSPDYTALGKTFSDNKKAVDDIVAGLTTAYNNPQIAANANAKAAVKTALDAYTAFDALLLPATPNNIPTTLTTLGGQVKDFQTKVDKLIKDNADPIAQSATKSITDMLAAVNGAVDNINHTIDDLVNVVNNVVDFFNQIETNLNEHDEVTGWITAGFKTVVTAPSVLALFAAFVAFVAGSFLAFKRKSLPSKGCCSASCTLIVFSILTLAITFIVMLSASFVMTLGYGTQLVCQPFFYDDKLQALTAVDNIIGDDIPPIPSMTPGKTVTLKFSEVMISCKDTNTFMQAVKGDEIIDVTIITNAIDVKSLTDQLDAAIDTAPIDPLNIDFTGLTTALGINLVPDLSAAQPFDSADIDAVTAQMQALKAALQPTIDTCNKAAASAQEFNDPKNTKNVLKSTSNTFIQSLSTELINTANQFSTDLMSKTAPCTPVYQSYEDVGHLGCEQMGGGVQGMWAGAGLAALFFVPTVIAVLFVASALRGGKTTKVNLPDDENPYISAFNSAPMVSPDMDQPPPWASEAKQSSPWESETAKPVPAAATYYSEAVKAIAPAEDDDSESECSMRL